MKAPEPRTKAHTPPRGRARPALPIESTSNCVTPSTKGSNSERRRCCLVPIRWLSRISGTFSARCAATPADPPPTPASSFPSQECAFQAMPRLLHLHPIPLFAFRQILLALHFYPRASSTQAERKTAPFASGTVQARQFPIPLVKLLFSHPHFFFLKFLRLLSCLNRLISRTCE